MIFMRLELTSERLIYVKQAHTEAAQSALLAVFEGVATPRAAQICVDPVLGFHVVLEDGAQTYRTSRVLS